ncbi:congested-like trachea protein [Atheta coriaria]
MAPVERVKCMLQIQREREKADRQFRGPIHLISAELAEGGISRIYKGFFATILREFPGSGIYFLTYEWFTSYHTVGTSATLLKMVIGGGMAGVVMWMIVLPFDTLKSRLQTAPPGTYTGLGHVFKDLMAHEGPAALYKGAVPVMARAFPANAACFLGFEFCNKQIVQRLRKPTPD